MFCPTCRAEYTPGIARCVDDGAALVEHLPERASHDLSEARFVVLRHVGLLAQAEMICDVLQQNGVRATVQSNSDVFAALFAATSRGTTIFVDERDLPRAREIYDAFFSDESYETSYANANSDEHLLELSDE